MSGDVKFKGTQEEWDALVKKNNADTLAKQNVFLERLINEEKELGEKISGFKEGLRSDGSYVKFSDYHFKLLDLQYCAMVNYRRVLVMRIEDLTK